MKRSFTMLEFMVAVAILSIGIIGVLRSFLSSADALDAADNYLQAVMHIDKKMNQIEERVVQKEELVCGSSEEQTKIGNRPAVEKIEISLPDDLEEKINEVKVSLSWQENNRAKDEIIATYFKKK